MSAWGVLAFDNDDACDWACGLEDVGDLSLVEGAILAIEESEDFIEVIEACNALAACEVLARLRGKPGYRNAYTEPVDRWVAAHRQTPPGALLRRAQAVIDAILGDGSELRELWDESDDAVRWREAVEDLRRRLTT